MSEANFEHDGVKDCSSNLLAGREAGGRQVAGEAAPPLAGRKCPACNGRGAVRVCSGLFEKFARCRACQGTGERSGPANDKDVQPRERL